MKKEVAEQIATMLLEINGKLNNSILLVMESGDEDEIKRYKRQIGGIMGEVFFSILDPIYKEHPELKPPELEG